MSKGMTLLLALAVMSAPLQAQQIRPQEATRLAAFDEIAGRALLRAMALGARGDVDMLQEALSGAPLPPLETSLEGDWSCRTLKLGELVPLVVYAAFKCRISRDGAQFRLEKLTGSQRSTGTIQMRDGQMIYLGVGTVGDAPAVAYDSLAPDFEGDGEVQPQVGIVEQPSPNAARILFPAPVTESEFDILSLTR